jgi:release factor glutamine methyltransferase
MVSAFTRSSEPDASRTTTRVGERSRPARPRDSPKGSASEQLVNNPDRLTKVRCRAALCAALNGRLNGIRVRALRGDLFEPVAAERFDLILTNPPYVPGGEPPRGGAARAWEAGHDGRAVIDRICERAPARLAPGGVLLIVQSEVCGVELTLRMLRAAGLYADIAAQHHGSLGPLLRSRRAALEARGLLRPGQASEDVLVLRGRAPAVRRIARTSRRRPLPRHA